MDAGYQLGEWLASFYVYVVYVKGIANRTHAVVGSFWCRTSRRSRFLTSCLMPGLQGLGRKLKPGLIFEDIWYVHRDGSRVGRSCYSSEFS